MGALTEAPAFSFDEYPRWARSLAVSYSADDLRRMMGLATGEAASAARAHLGAISRTTSMQSNSQARAHAGNSVAAAGERKKQSQRRVLHRSSPRRESRKEVRFESGGGARSRMRETLCNGGSKEPKTKAPAESRREVGRTRERRRRTR